MKREGLEINLCKQLLQSLEKKMCGAILICQEHHFIEIQILGAVPIICQDFKPAG